jgi:hypothetical protein
VGEGDAFFWKKMQLVASNMHKAFLLRAGGMAEVVEHPPSKHKAPSSNPSTAKNNNKNSLKKEGERLRRNNRLNLLKVHEVHVWKCHSEIPLHDYYT